MSAPTAPLPAFNFALKCVCDLCSKELYDVVCHTEQEVKEHTAKMLTASELHDCKAGPK